MVNICAFIKRSTLVSALLLISVLTFAQVSGTVTDENGDGLAGATVKVQGSSAGAITGIDGEFSVDAEPTGTLIVSFIGYSPQTIAVNGRSTVNVQLQLDAQSLEDVVVIGYGTVKKDDATGAVEKIDVSEVSKGTFTSPEKLLAGRSAGVQVQTNSGEPGAGSRIILRGGTSMGDNSPLIVVDGVALENEGIAGTPNPLNSINPNDIADITVLKDASAAAIYGSRGANGVIIITTKKGNAGSKLKLNYTGYAALSSITDKVDVLSSQEFQDIVNEKGSAGNIALMGYTDENGVRQLANTNWQDHVMNDAWSNRHNLTLTGGLEELGYRFSLGYNRENGIIIGNTLDIYNVGLGVNQSLFDDHLTYDINLKASGSASDFSDQGALGAAVSMDPTKPAYNADGTLFQSLRVDDNFNASGPMNPLRSLQLANNTGKSFRSIGNAKFDYRLHFFPDLTASVNLGYDRADGRSENIVNEIQTLGRKEYYKLELPDRDSKTFTGLLKYNKDVDQINSVFDITAGYEYFYNKEKYPTLEIRDGEVNDKRSGVDLNHFDNSLVSFFGRLNYTLLDRYLLTLTFRRDGSSRFSPENRWGNFPAASLAWRLSDEPFMQNSKTFSDLKLRLGYGVTGQQNGFADYDYIPRYSSSTTGATPVFNGSAVSTLRPAGYYEDIKWEETTTYNVGLDYGLFENKLTGTLEVYHKESNDLMATVTLPAGSNFTDILRLNLGTLENTGVEFTANAYPVETDDFSWNTGFNISYNKNELSNLITPQQAGGIGIGTGNNIGRYFNNSARDIFYLYEQVYDESGRPIEGLYVDQNGDNVINSDDKRPYQSFAPDVFAGLTNTLNYKDWDLSFLLRGTFGNWVYDEVSAGRAYFNTMIGQNDLNNSTPEILDSNFKQVRWESDYYLHDASFVKLDNITLGKRINNLFGGNTGARIFGTVENALSFTDYQGMDPEINGYNDNVIYPRALKSILGISLDF